jgi:predicted nucleic acid-binding protein
METAPAVAFLDTNVILRYLTQDEPAQAARARRFFQQVTSGACTAITSEAVIVEAVYVLSSRTLYHLPRAEIRTHLRRVLGLRGLKLPHKRTYLRALDLYAATALDFTDALIVAHMERARLAALVSFDRDFDRVPGISRHEP